MTDLYTAKNAVYCVLDFETRSRCDLVSRDTVNYAMDPSTQIISVSFVFLDSDKNLGKIHSFTTFKNGDMQKAEKILSVFRGIVVAHNYFFEQMIFTHVWKSSKLKHFTQRENYLCTSALAFRYGLPGSLKDAAISLDLLNQKSHEAGGVLIKKFSVPHNGVLIEPSEEDIKNFIIYGEQDTRTETELFQTLPGFDDFEMKVFCLDQKINQRGLNIDEVSLKKLLDKYKQIFDDSLREAILIAGTEDSGTPTIKSNSGLVRWLGEKGHDVPNAQKPILQKFSEGLKETSENKIILRALKLREILTAAAPLKLASILDKITSDGYVYKLLQYYGAHTGRFSGRSFQPHNLIRDAVDEKDFSKTVKSIVSGALSDYESVMTIGKLLRGLIIPHTGNVFIGGDFSAIEARVAFWLSGCKIGIKHFSDNDSGKGEEPYVVFAELSKLPRRFSSKLKRSIGKTAVLGLQYGMGFAKYSEVLSPLIGVKDPAFAKRIVEIYRTTYREIPAFWTLLENSFIAAIRTKKEIVLRDGLLKIKLTKMGVKVTLPSGRALYYRKPGIGDGGKFFYHHPRYKKIYLWGGSMFENIVQAISRDIMIEAMLEIDSHPDLEIALTVHDEILAETPVAKKKTSLDFFRSAMNKAPVWTPGLPIRASSGIMKRYGKG